MDCQVTGAVNGSFSLVRLPVTDPLFNYWTLTIPNAFTITGYSLPHCSGTVTSVSHSDLEIDVLYGGNGKLEINLGATGNYDQNYFSSSGRVGTTQNNDYAFGGTATISYP